MSKSTVKKALANLDAEALREMIMEMYAARREARDYLDFWASPDIEAELESAKNKIQKIFFMSADHPRRKPVMTDIKTIRKNFETLCPEPERLCDLLLHIPETMMNWLAARKGIGMTGNKPRIEKALAEAAAYIESSGMESQFGVRLQRLHECIQYFYDNVTPSTRGRRRWGWY